MSPFGDHFLYLKDTISGSIIQKILQNLNLFIQNDESFNQRLQDYPINLNFEVKFYVFPIKFES